MLNACVCFIYKLIYLKRHFFCKYFVISVETTGKYHRRNYKDCCKNFYKTRCILVIGRALLLLINLWGIKFYNYFYSLKKLYGFFLWMGFKCLKARATSRRQFSFDQTPQKLLVLILPTLEE